MKDFKRRATLTFDAAVTRHKTCEQAVDEFAKRQAGPDDARMTWDAIVTADAPPTDSFAEAVQMTMPIDAVPIVRSSAGVSASFAFERMANQFATPGDYYLQARAGWVEFEDRRKLANQVEEGYGCDKSASWELARDITQVKDRPLIASIAEMAGRMYRAMQGGRKVPSDEPHEVQGVKVGGEVERLLAEELTQLFDPDMSDAAAIRILEKQSQQYRMKGKMSASRGPLVIAVDESGSMHDDGHADRNSWAKACCVALTRIAHEGNRQVVVVHFGSATAVSPLVPGDHVAVLNMTRHFLSGGTDIAKALSVGAREVGNLAAQGFVGADIVLITDGGDGNHRAIDTTLGYAQAQGVRLWTVLIEMQPDPSSPIVTRASEVIRVGGTLRADMVASLGKAATNVVSAEEQRAADQRSMN